MGDVQIGGGSLPAVRIELKPFALNQYGISTEDVRAAIQASNATRPKGVVQGNGQRLQIYTQTPGLHASDYAPMVVAWRNGAAVRLQDVANVIDGVEDTRTLGLYNGEKAIIVLIRSQPAANVIETVDAVRALLPALQAELPADVDLHVASDRTHSIRASLHEIEITLIVAVLLVVLVVSAFLRSVRATLVPAVATVTALLGTFGVMYLLGFSLDNLSLMALDRGHRIRRRRRDRRAREHEPPHRGRHDADEGSAARRPRSRLHRRVDQPVARRCVHSAAVHGGAAGALVPRVRRDTVGGGADLARRVADDHADDVRVAAEARRCEREAPGLVRAHRRARLRLGPRGATSRASTGRSRARHW